MDEAKAEQIAVTEAGAAVAPSVPPRDVAPPQQNAVRRGNINPMTLTL